MTRDPDLKRLHFWCAVVTLPIWIGPFLWDLYRNPPRRWA